MSISWKGGAVCVLHYVSAVGVNVGASKGPALLFVVLSGQPHFLFCACVFAWLEYSLSSTSDQSWECGRAAVWEGEILKVFKPSEVGFS